ncbi:carboxymuconolactone decarboxylase family protein [Cytobacillus spongiae]|uniref:carboxymuconolactone decarboxylase family protein n=1 Tax=Cytobacillus spongiae TaxID=2901381 RepID=UPI001F19CCA7|nr:carboxymuconolactone decarboxylase family protein [Cytobacillus spongiae]UII54725.1 carboxymuconolactone decarboxylase family protein [Cytobacillus spongiae]
MARIIESRFGETPFQRLLGHNQQIMERWSELGDLLASEGRLLPELKEQVRRTLAQKNGCEYCRVKGRPDLEGVDEKTALAVGFTEVFLQQKGNITDTVFDVLRDSFTEEEISELCAFLCFTTASQYFGAIMKLT